VSRSRRTWWRLRSDRHAARGADARSKSRRPRPGTTGSLPTTQLLPRLQAHLIASTPKDQGRSRSQIGRAPSRSRISVPVRGIAGTSRAALASANLSLTFDREPPGCPPRSLLHRAIQPFATRVRPRAPLRLHSRSAARTTPTAKLRFTGTADRDRGGGRADPRRPATRYRSNPPT